LKQLPWARSSYSDGVSLLKLLIWLEYDQVGWIYSDKEIEIQVVGLRPGRNYEELLNNVQKNTYRP
jgi:FlaA1/EpsC-like NDP-sugar epimerase